MSQLTKLSEPDRITKSHILNKLNNRPNCTTGHIVQPRELSQPNYHHWRNNTTESHNRPSRTTDRIAQPTESHNRPNRTTDRIAQPTKSHNRPNRTTDRIAQPIELSQLNRIVTTDQIAQLTESHNRPKRTTDRIAQRTESHNRSNRHNPTKSSQRTESSQLTKLSQPDQIVTTQPNYYNSIELSQLTELIQKLIFLYINQHNC